MPELSPSEQSTRRQPEQRLGKKRIRRAGGALLLWALASCGGGPGTQEKAVDCGKNPHGKVAITVNTKKDEFTSIGNAVKRKDGTLDWQERIILESHGTREAFVSGRDGFTWRVAYEDAKERGESFAPGPLGQDRGLTAQPGNAPEIEFTYYCDLPDGLSPTGVTSPKP